MIISHNSIVTLEYRVNDDEGNLIDAGNEPIVYLHGGYGSIFAPIEASLEGKKVGDIFKVEMQAHEAFGDYQKELVVGEALENLPEGLELGMEIDGYTEDNEEDIIVYRVVRIEADHAILDANHPLAGIDIVFEGIVKEIREADETEIEEILNYPLHT